MQAHKGLNVDIRIKALNVCVGMVINVVLNLPVVSGSSQHVKKMGGNFINQVVPGKALVPAIMHNIEPDQCEIKTKQDTQQ